MKLVTRALRPGLIVGFLRILCNGSVLHRDFTLKNMITLAVFDAQMNLSLSHITMSVDSCTTFLLLSGDVLHNCHREIIFYHDLVTRVFLQSLRYGIVVLGLP